MIEVRGEKKICRLLCLFSRMCDCVISIYQLQRIVRLGMIQLILGLSTQQLQLATISTVVYMQDFGLILLA